MLILPIFTYLKVNNFTTDAQTPGERLIKVYFRHDVVRVVLKNLLTYNRSTNFLSAPLPCPDKNTHSIRGSLERDLLTSLIKSEYIVASRKFQIQENSVS